MMKIQLTYILLSATLLSISACHTRMEAGRQQKLSKNTPVPASSTRQADTTTRTPTAQYTPNVVRIPNIRPKPVPQPQPPVPPQ